MYKHRKYTSIILLCLTAFPTAVALISSLCILWIKHEMKEKLEISHLHTITIKNTDIRWNEIHQEIILGNTLFDVKSYSTKGDFTTFEGIYDKEEMSLSNLAENSISTSKENKQLTQMGIFFQQLQYMYDQTEYKLWSGVQKIRNRTYIENHYSSPTPSNPTPPPDSSMFISSVQFINELNIRDENEAYTCALFGIAHPCNAECTGLKRQFYCNKRAG